MKNPYEFLRLILDTVAEHIVVIDGEGNILYANHSWNSFGKANACLIQDQWVGVNYLRECDNAAAMGDDFGGTAASGIRQVINSENDAFYFEYPCHSPDENRWFMMRVTPFVLDGCKHCVISHQNITERKTAEEELLSMSRIDGLTDIPNRRYFDEFLSDEWKRCARLGQPLSLALIDVDHFKLFNDTYGHPAGDECLKMIGSTLKNFANRPSDICARYGGEEFSVVYGNASLQQSRALIGELNAAIRALNLPNEKSPVSKFVTVSIGLATVVPGSKSDAREIIRKADSLLYAAKEKGRNQMLFSDFGRPLPP